MLPAWGGRDLATIRKRDIVELVSGVEGNSAQNGVFALIKTVFRYAVAQDWMEQSPVEGLQRPNKELPRDRVLSMNELSGYTAPPATSGTPQADLSRQSF